MNRLSRGFGLITTTLLSLGLVLGAAPVAHADAPPNQLTVSDAQPGVDPSSKTVTGVTFLFDRAPEAGTVIHVAAFSCGNFLQESTRTTSGASDDYRAYVFFSPDGMPVRDTSNPVAKKVSKSIQYQVDVVQPGFDGYSLSGSITDYGMVDGKPVSDSRPSCAEINGGGTGGTGGSKCVVNVKAKTVGQARVGRTVKVSPPRTSGACGKASYTWKANGKTVKKGKSFQLRKDLRGKNVAVKVNLSKGPDRVLRFGRVK